MKQNQPVQNPTGSEMSADEMKRKESMARSFRRWERVKNSAFMSWANRHRRPILFFIDTIAFLLIVMTSVFFNARYNYRSISSYLREKWISYVSIYVIMMVARLICKVYLNVWRYPNIRAYFVMVLSDCISGTIAFVANRLLYRVFEGIHIGFWNTYCVVALFCVITLAMRFAYQMLCRKINESEVEAFEALDTKNKINVVIVGAGQVGTLLADELKVNPQSHYDPFCFVERDPAKVGGMIGGLKVYGESDIVEKIKTWPVQEIFLAMPKLSTDELNELYEMYTQTGCKVKLYSLPTGDKAELYNPPSLKGMIRRLTAEDYIGLLGRDPLLVNNDETRAFYRDRVVLVTGGGGSIGSEICRQIAKCRPKKLIVFDIYENNAYNIQMELSRDYGAALDLEVEIGSVRDVARLESVFANYRPEVVFHAAAHKHVPLMEHSSCEAIKNNVLGTYNTANMAEKYGVERFVLVSTDKAVNPTNVMGASKRMCEMVIQCRKDSATTFAAVRFGNVLGSNGSVIPLFQDQIAEGGPVTVTSKDIIRYFMTIPEASQLVMQAGAMAKSGELFVLDMGAPVRIWSLAENLIYLSGYIPGKDIEIKEVGLRPGEKLYEGLLINTSTTLSKTSNDLIFVEADEPLTRAEVDAKLDLLRRAVEDAQDDLESPIVRDAMKAAVPTFKEASEVNRTAAKSKEMQQAAVLAKK